MSAHDPHANRPTGSAPTATQDAEATEERVAESVTVIIRGKPLKLRSDEPHRLQQWARYLDDQLGDLQRSAPSAPFEKLLMAASLNIVKELFDAREAHDHLSAELAERIAVIEALLAEHDEEMRDEMGGDEMGDDALGDDTLGHDASDDEVGLDEPLSEPDADT